MRESYKEISFKVYFVRYSCISHCNYLLIFTFGRLFNDFDLKAVDVTFLIYFSICIQYFNLNSICWNLLFRSGPYYE